MTIQQFGTTLDPDLYFQGLARQSLDFQSALGELVDNSFSARAYGPGGVSQNIAIEIGIRQTGTGTVQVHVADNGIGIPLTDITERIFNLGGQGESRGQLNEHGFGLKNALALLTGGNAKQFHLITRSAADNLDSNQFLRVDGPLSTSMSVRTDAQRSEWSDGLSYLADVDTGTKITVDVAWQYFRTLYRRGTPGLDFLAARLGEQLGVMHRYFLDSGNKIHLSYRGANGDWVHKEVQSIPVPFEGQATEVKRKIEVNGIDHHFTYRHGVLDYSVKDTEAETELGWPYPLRSYYQGSNARCGIDVVVRGRVIKTAVFEEVWPEIAKTVDFNRFVGELSVGADFHTTNNKTGLDPHADNWEQLLQKLGEETFRPEKATRSDSEKSLRDRLVHILKGTFNGAKVTAERKVWGGAIALDIFVDAGEDNRRVYELKVTPGRVVDLYQLLAGWDGLVREGIKPSNGILVVKEYSQSLQDAVDDANMRRDSSGDLYAIDLRKIDDLVPTI